MYQFIYGKYDRSFDDYKILTLKNSNNDWIAREILSAINVHPVDLDTYKQFYHFRVNFPDTQEIFIGICTYIRDYNRDSENRYTDFLHIRGEFNEKEEKNLFKDLYFWKAPISFTKDTKLDIEIQSLMKPEDDHIYPIIDWLFENWLNKRKCFLPVKNDKDSFLIDELKLISLYDLARNEPVLHTLFYVLSNLPPILSNKIIAQFGYDNEYSNVPQYAHLIVGFDRLLSTTTKNFQRPIESNIDFYNEENKPSINYKNITLWKYIIEDLQNDQELLSYIRPKTLSDSIDAISKKASGLAFKKIINILLEDIDKSDFETHLADYNQHIKNNPSNIVEIILIKTYFDNNPLYYTRYYDEMYRFMESKGIRIKNKFQDLLNGVDVKTLSTFKPIADESVHFKEIYNAVVESKESLPSSNNDKPEQIDIEEIYNAVVESKESLPSSDNDKPEQIDIKEPNNAVMEFNEILPSSDDDKPDGGYDEAKDKIQSNADKNFVRIRNVLKKSLNFISFPIISWKKRKNHKKRKKFIKKLKEEYNLTIADSKIINGLDQIGISNEEISIFLNKELTNTKYDTIKEKLQPILCEIDSTTQTEQAFTNIKKNLSIKLYTIINIIILIILITFYLNKIVPNQDNSKNDSNYLIKKRIFQNPLIIKDLLMNNEIKKLVKNDSILVDSIVHKTPNGQVSVHSSFIEFDGNYIKIIVGPNRSNQNYPNYIYIFSKKYIIIYKDSLMVKDSLIFQNK